MKKTTTRFRLLWRLWHAHVAWSLSLIALSSTVMKTTFPSDGDSSELPPDRQNVTCLKPLANFSITLTDDDDAKARNIDEFYGQCVGAHWRDRSGLHYATAIVGADLFRTAGECSDRAARRNVPPGWDFSSVGMCGKGRAGLGHWRDCFVHDVCVWANCARDDAIPGGFVLLRPLGNDPSRDADCGAEYDAAIDDWIAANVVQCEHDTDCESGRCGWKNGQCHVLFLHASPEGCGSRDMRCCDRPPPPLCFH